MKKLLSLLVLLVPLISFAGNNDIYLTQTGTGLTLTIDQIGATNTIGTSQARAIVSGASMTIDLDQIGDSNIIAASILQAGSSSWTYKATGDSNTATFAVGGTGDVAGSDLITTQRVQVMYLCLRKGMQQPRRRVIKILILMERQTTSM